MPHRVPNTQQQCWHDACKPSSPSFPLTLTFITCTLRVKYQCGHGQWRVKAKKPNLTEWTRTFEILVISMVPRSCWKLGILEPLCKLYMPEELGLEQDFCSIFGSPEKWRQWWCGLQGCPAWVCWDLIWITKIFWPMKVGAINTRAHRKCGSKIFCSKQCPQ